MRTLGAWLQRPTAEVLMSLRSVSTITAMTVLAELGDLPRFDSPRLTAYSAERLEAACQRALDIGTLNYGSVKSILATAGLLQPLRLGPALHLEDAGHGPFRS